MGTKPELSVITVNYNGYGDTVALIDSLRKISGGYSVSRRSSSTTLRVRTKRKLSAGIFRTRSGWC